MSSVETSRNAETPDLIEHYQIMTPDGYHTKLHTVEELLEKYVRMLGPLVEEIAGNEQQPGYDTVVLLDKSGRPLGWMLRKFWPYLAPQRKNPDTGEIETAPMPDFKFVNIDRLYWRKDPSKEIEEGGARDINPEDIEGLRSIFTTRREKNGEMARRSVSELDGKRVLIIDEQSESGDTLKAAEELFKRAFPEADIGAMPWIRHMHNLTPAGAEEHAIEEIPVWYPPKHPLTRLHKETGRGVLGPVRFDEENPKHGDPMRFPPESYQFLSRAPYIPKQEFTEDEELELASLRETMAEESDPDEKAKLRKKIESLRRIRDPESLQLRREIGQMLIDFEKGRIMPFITTQREEVLGIPVLEYRKKARDIRGQRQRYRK